MTAKAILTPDLHDIETIRTAMERNMAGHMAWSARHLPGATVRSQGGVTLVDSGLATDTFNVVCNAELDAATSDAAIAEAIGWFTARKRPFSWWVGPGSQPTDLAERLISAGLTHAEDEAAMYLDLALLDDAVPAVAGITIRQATTPDDLVDFASVVAANWVPPDPDVITFYRRTAEEVLAPDSPLRFWVACSGDLPVAGCETYFGDGVAGLYAVVTREAYRRRGIGMAVTRTALQQAHREGYRIGTLQASGQGQSIYERIGFMPCGIFQEFKPA